MLETCFLISSETVSIFLMRLTTDSRKMYSPLGLMELRFWSSEAKRVLLRPMMMALGFGICFAKGPECTQADTVRCSSENCRERLVLVPQRGVCRLNFGECDHCIFLLNLESMRSMCTLEGNTETEMLL